MSIDTSALGVVWKKDEGVVEKIASEVPPPKPVSPTTDRCPADIRQDAIAALQLITDPEIPLNIWDLGLVYELICEPAGFIDVKMTLTSPMCPAIGSLPSDVKYKLAAQSSSLTLSKQ